MRSNTSFITFWIKSTSKAFLIIFIFVSLTACSSLGSPPEKSKPDVIREYLFHSKKARTRYYNAYNKTLKLFTVPVEEVDVKTRFGKAHIIVSGPKDAPALVLLHGMDASSTMWYPNMEALSQSHRVYAIDYIMDCGKSELKTGPLNKAQVVLFYNDIFDKLKIDKFDILGTSRGGWIAAWLAIQPASKIKRLVLMSPAQVLAMVNIKIFPAIIFKLFPSHKNLNRTFTVFSQHPGKIAPEFKEQFYIASKYGNSQAQVMKMMPFSHKQLAALKIPVLLLVGDHDIMNGKRAMDKATAYIANVKIEKISDSGHFMSTDQTEIVDKIVLDFLH
jgi:pimeloyl-ACP methyl ester carboxylesterase